MTAINTNNSAAATALTCDKTDPGVTFSTLGGEFRKVRLDKVNVLGATGATIGIYIAPTSPSPILILAQARDGVWCITP